MRDMDEGMSFDERELGYILEALNRFKADIDMWGYIVPRGSTQVDLTHEYRTAISSLQARIEARRGEKR